MPPARASRTSGLLVAGAAAGLALVAAAAARTRLAPPRPDPGAPLRATAPPVADAAEAPWPARTLALPDGQPPTLVQLTTDGRRAVLSSTYGAAEAGTVVVDLAAGTSRRLPLGGGVLDAARDQVVGWAVSGGAATPQAAGPADPGAGGPTSAHPQAGPAPGGGDPDLIVAVRLADGAEAWRTRVGFCGGAFALAGDRVHAAFQGGARRRAAGPDGPATAGGDDPLLVLDAATGALVAGPRRAGGVVGSILVDAAGRSWVGVDRRALCFGPPPGLALEHELHGLRPVAADAAGRVLLRALEAPARLVTLDGPLAAPARTGLPLPGAAALDPAGRRLFVADQVAGRVQVLDARTLALERTLVVDPVALQSALAVTPDGRRLLVATAAGGRRALHVVELE